MKNWSNREVYVPNQEVWADDFVNGRGNLGFLCGAPSDSLVVLDFDTAETWKALKRHFEGKTTVVKSGSGKIHVYLRTHPDNLPKTRRIHEGNVGIDIQSTGAYVVAPASTHPDTGKLYEFISKYPPMLYEGDVEYDVLEWIREEFGLPFNIEKVDVQEINDGVAEGERDHAAIVLATYYRLIGKTKGETEKLLKEWNKRNKPPMPNEVWWIHVKVESAWRHDQPYRYRFLNTEIHSREVREKAEWLLNNPDEILPYIKEATADIIDEDTKKVIGVLLLFGKQSLEISGESGEGKSNLADAIVDMLPKDWVEKITSLSPHALRHTDKQDGYRCIYLAERRGLGTGKAGQETEADYDMKVSISEGFIKAQIAEKQTDGSIKTITKTIKIESFLMTTTEIAPPPELANRLWNLSIDESIEHRHRVASYILHQETLMPEKRAVTIVKPKREVLRCMFGIAEKETEGLTPIIPYADVLMGTFPMQSAGLYRHIKKLLSLMKITARLYYRKCKKTDKFLIAPPEIYGKALQIGEEAIKSQFLNMTEKQREFWMHLKNKLTNKIEMTLNDITKEFGMPPSTSRNWLNFIEDLGLIASRYEGREKVVSLRTVEQTRFSRADTAKIQEAYNRWCNENGV